MLRQKVVTSHALCHNIEMWKLLSFVLNIIALDWVLFITGDCLPPIYFFIGSSLPNTVLQNIWKLLKMLSEFSDNFGIKFWVLLNRAPSSTQLHPPSLSSFQPPPSSLQHPQQYLNQNIAHNWAISPNLGRKIKRCPFWLKIDTHVILEVLIPNPDLDFLKFRSQNPFLGKFGPKNSKLSV